MKKYFETSNEQNCKNCLVTEKRMRGWNKKAAFTLTEGTSCIDLPQLVACCAFTLAEVLITLVIVGVVAAMTIPTLMATINEKVNARQIEVAQKRLAESLKLYNTQESAFNGKSYESTYDFLNNGLSKYFKMTSICDADHIGDCWPTGTINYADNDGNIQTINASELKTPEKLNLDNDGYYAPASFISGSGIPYIMVLKKGCIIDPDSRAEDSDIWSCIDGLWDYQGTRQPNTLGKDVKSINSASINAGPQAPACLYTPNGVCMAAAPFYPSQAMANFVSINCNALKNGKEATDTSGLFGARGAKVKVNNSFFNCPYTGRSNYDYWLAGKLKCESMGYRLPTEVELAKIVAAIYGYTGNVNQGWSYRSYGQVDISIYGFELYPAPGAHLTLWSESEDSSDSTKANNRHLLVTNQPETYRTSNARNNNGGVAICIGE